MVEPIDFEGFVAKNKMLIQNDPQRELLIYPNDDVSVSLMYSVRWAYKYLAGFITLGFAFFLRSF